MKPLLEGDRVAKAGAWLALAMALFHLYTGYFGPPDAIVFRAIHLGFALTLAFLIYPRGNNAIVWMSAAIGLVVSAYPIVSLDYINNRMIYVDDMRLADWVFGGLMLITLLEATRRAIGLALPVTALLFLTYAVLVADSDLPVLLEQIYVSTEGIFGIPISVSATYVILFIIFGALVERSGAGRLFMDFALSLTGSSAGGPAKVACVTSGLFGTVSGSAVANVMTTGAFTIPLMKRLGYKPAFAGAVEAVASTGGQIMPPIMGAAAFVMAAFLGVSYLTVAAYALVPAILYYLAVFMAVHFEAKRLGLEGLPREECPRLAEVLWSRGHLFLPLILLVAVLLSGYSAPFAALCGIASVIPSAALRAGTRRELDLSVMLEGLIVGARSSVAVALACGCAGIVIGVITLTGLGIEFTSLVLAVSQNSLLVALVLSMLAGIILGMGMPTSPAYIMQVALLVPAIVKLGVPVEAAHLFALYFAILSAITPPVALAVYAANGISGAGLWPSGLAALKLGATGYIVPFMFVFSPSLLLIGSWHAIALTVATAIIGVTCLSSALAGYFATPLALWQRGLLLGAALTLIKPGLWTDLAGSLLIGAALVLPSMVQRRVPQQP